MPNTPRIIASGGAEQSDKSKICPASCRAQHKNISSAVLLLSSIRITAADAANGKPKSMRVVFI